MVNLVSKIAIVSVAFIAILYQFIFKSIIFDSLGYGRSVSTISAFDVKCQRIDELGLESCEDMWLHEPTGYLYMACSDSQSRTQWLPAVDALNATARGTLDRVAVLDTRSPGLLKDRIQWLTVESFPGINGDGTLNLHGLSIRADGNTDNLRLLLVNHRPPLDPVTGELLDATAVGANSTIELFQTKAGSDSMRHVRTYTDGLIQTPNRVAWVNNDSFVLTNDHSTKTGFRRHLDPFLGGGNVIYCSPAQCNIASPTSHTFHLPNGLIYGLDSLIYVPSTLTGTIDVFSLNEQRTLTLLDSIKLPYPIDNLSQDKDGDIFASAFPQSYKWGQSSKDPFSVKAPAAVFRVRKSGPGETKTHGREEVLLHGKLGDWEIEKILEDDGSVVGGATTTVHDTETGRLWIGGCVAPFISMCETR